MNKPTLLPEERRKRRALPAIESFGPELLASLIRGSNSELKLEGSYKQMVVLRRRLHELRAAMRERRHDLYHIVQKAQLEITWPADTPVRTSRKGVKYPVNNNAPVTLRISPHDSEFADIFKRAGVTAHQLDDGSLVQTEAPSLDEILAGFGSGGQK